MNLSEINFLNYYKKQNLMSMLCDFERILNIPTQKNEEEKNISHILFMDENKIEISIFEQKNDVYYSILFGNKKIETNDAFSFLKNLMKFLGKNDLEIYLNKKLDKYSSLKMNEHDCIFYEYIRHLHEKNRINKNINNKKIANM